jgi:aspartyl/asparaginyl beta-hydroxylase (cupin superfamily)
MILIISIIIFITFLIYYILKYLRDPYNLTLLTKKFVGSNPPILNKEELFPESKMLEENWQIIAEECKKVMNTYGNTIPEFYEMVKTQENLSNGKWRMYMLRLMGKDIPNNIKNCPKTMELINKCKGIRTAFFSILEPGMNIDPHTGYEPTVLRYHLGLIVPEPKKYELKVDKITKNWYEGEGFLWDDMFLHSVKNKGTQKRVILFLDVERRNMNFMAKILDKIVNTAIKIHPTFRDAIKNAEPKIEYKKI